MKYAHSSEEAHNKGGKDASEKSAIGVQKAAQRIRKIEE